MPSSNSTYYCHFPVRDGERTIDRVMDSLVNQTFRPSKIIAVEDGSGDRTPEILARWQQRYPDMIEIISTHSKTRDYRRIPHLWNLCIRDGYDYQMIGAGDIEFEPTYCERIIKEMDKDSNLVICSGDYGNFKSKAPHGAGRIIRHSFFAHNYSRGYPTIVGYESETLERALMLGLKLKVFHDVKFEHMDTLGHSHNFVEFGYSMRALGYYPPYVLGRFILDFVRNGDIGKRGAINMLRSYLTYKPDGGYYGHFPQDVRASISNRQKMMIKKMILKRTGLRRKIHDNPEEVLDRGAVAEQSY